ncbi:hypothetical protein Hanom_Chr09g00863451 [Helianthus anomalus]
MRRRVNHHHRLHCRRFWFRSPPEWRRCRLSTADLSMCVSLSPRLFPGYVYKWYKRGMKLRGIEGVSPEAIRRSDYRLLCRSVAERERERAREGKRVEVRF